MGRGKYEAWLREERLALLAGWARDGLDEAVIAGRVGVRVDTLRAWRRRFAAIDRALGQGREVADYAVESALLRAACGYEYIEETREPLLDGGEPVLDEAGQPRTRVVKVVTKYAQPSLSAASYWLKNRKGRIWRDRPDPEAEEGERERSNLLEAICGAAAGAFAPDADEEKPPDEGTD